MPSWVGDTVMATPLLAAIREQCRRRDPEIRITGYMRPGLDELLAGGGFVDEMITGQPSGALGPWRAGRAIAAHAQFDAAILLPNSGRLALTVLFAGCRKRVGFGRDGRSLLLTRAVPCPFDGGWKAPRSTVDYYLALGAALGAPAIDARLRLSCTADQRERGDSILREAGIGAGEPFAVLNPGANRDDKRWPAERFAAVADHLSSRYGLRALVSGAPREQALIDLVCSAAKSSRPIALPAFRPTLGTLKPILERARLLVTNDTGPRHIAAAMGFSRPDGVSIITIFGPTDPRYAEINYSREAELSTGGRPIEEISTAQVIEVCDAALSAASGTV